MEYEPIEEAGNINIDMRGNKLDTYSLGILQINFQEIFDKVALAALYSDGYIKQRRPFFRYRTLLPPYSDFRIIKAEIQSIQVGSLLEDIVFYIPVVLADPNVRAVLHGLAANIIYTIGSCGVKGILFCEKNKNYDERPQRLSRHPDVGDNMRDIALVLAKNGGGEITFTSTTPKGTKKSVTLIVNEKTKSNS